ncbi:MAG: hypothetical protein ACRDTC_02655 [Pseudonocardiaceae bacterium]
MMHLTGTELLDCIALRRVRGGGVALHGSGHLDQGRRMPCYLPDVFRRLAEMELTELLSPDYSAGPRRVVLTPRGQVRYRELTAKRDSCADPEQSSGACSVPPDRPSSRLRPVRGLTEGAIR